MKKEIENQKILQACYSAFLDGLGYSGANWRETEESAPTF